jgi:hypothetical protein
MRNLLLFFSRKNSANRIPFCIGMRNNEKKKAKRAHPNSDQFCLQRSDPDPIYMSNLMVESGSDL